MTFYVALAVAIVRLVNSHDPGQSPDKIIRLRMALIESSEVSTVGEKISPRVIYTQSTED